MSSSQAKRNHKDDDVTAVNEQNNDEAPAKKKRTKSSSATDSDTKSNVVATVADNTECDTNPTPIFLKKTYKMIDSCDPETCAWSSDGLSFIVKDPDRFAAEVIPQYFDHNKFSSFARQLNFYGFRKIQTKPIKNSDYDESTAKHVTFFNEKFRKGRQDLLREITRSTRSGGPAAQNLIPNDIKALRSTVTVLEQRVAELEEKLIQSSNEMKAKVDLIVMELTASRHQQQGMLQAQMGTASIFAGGRGPAGLLQAPMAPVPATAVAAGAHGPPVSVLGDSTLGDAAACTLSNAFQMCFSGGENTSNEQQLHQAPPLGDTTNQRKSNLTAEPAVAAPISNGATLPPHPKQKMLPQLPDSLSGSVQSQIAQSRGQSESDAVLALATRNSLSNSFMLRNAWENDLFTNLMKSDGSNGSGLATNPSAIALSPRGLSAGGLSALAAAQAQQQMALHPAYLQSRSLQGVMDMGAGMLPPGMGLGTNPIADALGTQFNAAVGDSFRANNPEESGEI